MQQAVAWILLVALALGGCATHTQTGGIVGGATGAAVGGSIGGTLGGSEGALIGFALGTIIGAVTGAMVGSHFEDRQQRTRTEASQVHAYRPSHGPLLVVSGLEAAPAVVTPRNPVQVTVSYDVLAPERNHPVPITETWVFMHNTAPLKTIARPEARKEQGGYTSTYTLALAKDAPAGDYRAVVTVSNGVTATTVATQFQVQNWEYGLHGSGDGATQGGRLSRASQ